MAEAKTKPTSASVDTFVGAISDARKRADARALIEIMRSATGESPRMWGPSIIGFGTYHYRYDSGREGEMCLVGFSPRSAAFAIYLTGSAGPAREALLARLGKHTTGKGCLYIKRLDDVDAGVLADLVRLSVKGTGSDRTAG